MHETALVNNLIKLLEKETRGEKIKNVKKIKLEAGELRYIVPELIKAAYSQFPKDEKLTDADIEIKVLPVKVRCQICGEESVIKDRDFKCAKCKKRKLTVISGDEFVLKSIEW